MNKFESIFTVNGKPIPCNVTITRDIHEDISTCPVCNCLVIPEYNFCPTCGTQLIPEYCPHCGKQL